MPTVEHINGVKVTTFSPADLERNMRMRKEAAERLGISLKRPDHSYPSLYDLTTVVAMGYSYKPSDESERIWKKFLAYSEWTRIMVTLELKLAANSTWEEIYKTVGVFPKEKYESEEKYYEALVLGQCKFIFEQIAKLIYTTLDDLQCTLSGKPV